MKITGHITLADANYGQLIGGYIVLGNIGGTTDLLSK
jgi:hypothetical protein